MQRVCVLDLWDEARVSGLEVRLDDVSLGSTSPAGDLTVPVGTELQRAVVSAPYKLAAVASAEAVTTMWVHRTANVTLRIDLEQDPPGAVSHVSVTWHVAPPMITGAATLPLDPWTPEWMAEHHLSRGRPVRVPVTAAGGGTLLDVPRVRHVLIAVAHAGNELRPAVALPEFAPDGATGSASVVLKRTRWITGRIRMSDGSVLPPDAIDRARLVAEHHSRRLPSELDLSAAQVSGWGIGIGGTLSGNDRLDVMLGTSGSISKDGTFRVPFIEPSDLRIVVSIAGYPTAIRVLDAVSEPPVDLELTLDDGRVEAVLQLRDASAPLPGSTLTVGGEEKGATRVDLGSYVAGPDGTVRMRNLEVGRTYFLVVRAAGEAGGPAGTWAGEFKWTGQNELRVDRDLTRR